MEWNVYLKRNIHSPESTIGDDVILSFLFEEVDDEEDDTFTAVFDNLLEQLDSKNINDIRESSEDKPLTFMLENIDQLNHNIKKPIQFYYYEGSDT